MGKLQDLIVYLAFEYGRAYERLYTSLGLNNILDFNDAKFAQSCGAQFSNKGTINDIGQLYRCKINSSADEAKRTELNKIADNIKWLQTTDFNKDGE